MRERDHHQTDIARVHDRRVAVEDREQSLSEEQYRRDRDGKRGDALRYAQRKRFSAPPPEKDYRAGPDHQPHGG